MSPSTYSPGQIVELTGFSLDTLRYYERIGLIEPVRRAVGGQRRYTQDDVEWLDVLRCLRGTGMPIARMKEFTDQVRAGDHTIADRLALLEEHDRAVARQLAQLEQQRAKVREKITYYRGAAAAQRAWADAAGAADGTDVTDAADALGAASAADAVEAADAADAAYVASAAGTADAAPPHRHP
ncbi:MerR family transcriptional regulator [Actinospica sp. MGRD01-02]|uniref:MerR family transcriptional regulator n=1 Tax=Actinospica acidithermotolerans TaxID=2828514 RepID=A0A941E902_9ACTN|nr:MerR family transcriptional regulator [Actinospica acidithermotolerans]MBR7825745.1 MerR family transcriptional regulator [Actinospica acidithermotolerans]